MRFLVVQSSIEGKEVKRQNFPCIFPCEISLSRFLFVVSLWVFIHFVEKENIQKEDMTRPNQSAKYLILFCDDCYVF
jgi:hypothetical protein